jgi:hypothetical protein
MSPSNNQFNQFNHFEFSYATDCCYTFNDESQDRNHTKQENLFLQDQAGENLSIFNLTKKQSMIEDFEKTNHMTIFEVKE